MYKHRLVVDSFDQTKMRVGVPSRKRDVGSKSVLGESIRKGGNQQVTEAEVFAQHHIFSDIG